MNNLCKIVSISLFALLLSCNSKNKVKDVDLSNIPQPKITIHRYEKALFTLDQSKIKSELEHIRPEFLLFLNADFNDTSKIVQISEFINYPFHQDIYDTISTRYPDLKNIESNISNAYRHLFYYFPNEKLPTFYSYISGLDVENNIMLSANNEVVIALDGYLGSNFEMYKKTGIPQYITKRTEPEYLARDIMGKIVNDKYLGDKETRTLFDAMILEGKKYFFIHKMIPSLPEDVVIGTTPEKIKWAYDNEERVWIYFVENNMLFSPDINNLRKLVSDAPFTNGMTTNSPGNIGGWIGYQIIKKYADKHPEVELKDLILKKNPQEILRESQYKPS
ncbi:MAG: hypothetical protein ACEPOV_12095 [Hyphomicrobiales bacterium]